MHIMFRMCMLAMMLLTNRAGVAADVVQQTGDGGVVAQHTDRLPPAYPDWREYQINRNIVPPPAGPYMSTALTPMPGVYQSDFGNEQNAGTEMANSPFFMPDMQWPEEKRMPPKRWMPEKGQYQYVPDEVLEKQRQFNTGYSRNYPRMEPVRTNTRPVYQSWPAVERPHGNQGN